MTELLVGTKKGLFVLEGDAGAEKPFEVAARAFPGNVVEFAIRDPRSGRYFASVTSGHFGPRVMHTMDPTGEWEPTTGLGVPRGRATGALERIWAIKPGEADGLMYAGVAPAGLFTSTDGGMTWELNRALYDQPSRSSWQPGAGGLCLHSIATWPGDPSRLAIGISAVGVWLSEDGGESWRHGNEGLVPRYVPEDAQGGTIDLCVHNMHRAPLRARNGCSCSSTAASTAATTRARVDLDRRGTPGGLRLPDGARSRRPRLRVRDPDEQPTATASPSTGERASSARATRASRGPR